MKKRVTGQPQTAMRLLEKGEELTSNSLAEATGGTVQGARQALSALYSRGEIHRKTGGPNGQFVFYLNGKTSTNGNGKSANGKQKQARRRTPEPPASSMSLMWSDGDKMLFDLDGETWFARKV